MLMFSCSIINTIFILFHLFNYLYYELGKDKKHVLVVVCYSVGKDQPITKYSL